MPQDLASARNLIFPALVTPLAADGTLDRASAERLIDHLYARGVGGLYVAGGTGEGIYLDVATRRSVVELAVAMSRGRGRVIAHVGAVEGSVAFELAAHAAAAGADAVASIPPFAGGYSWDEVLGYYRRLCRVSSLPVFGYYIPEFCRQRFSIDQLAELAKLENFAGFKITDVNLYTIERVLGRLRPGQLLFNGPDELLALGLALGAHGGVGTSYNVMPDLILEISAASVNNRFREALAGQQRANGVIEALLGFQLLAATKQVLVWQGLIASATCAAPRAMLDASEQAALWERLKPTAIGDTLQRR
ncbi:MAG TPA: dihydrodipicolinate synthase family protein [Pirellulales bacterium]|jgi:N-acetylneuraminate lyase|nr:dihydrodipicolinate synthase family protein [Pirellulales bacterium]